LTEISLITPSLNAASTLESCIESVASQTQQVKHILIDGGSADQTLSIAHSRMAHFQTISSESDQGIYDAINRGILLAGSSIVGLLHSDDLLADHRVIEDVQEAFANPDVHAVYGDLDYVDRSDGHRVVRHWRAGGFLPGKMYHGWMPPHPTFFVRRECFERFGLYRLDLGTAADYELMLRFLLVHDIRVQYLPRVLVKMRVGGASNVNLRARLQANRMDREAWEVNGLKPYPWTLIAKPLRKLGQWWPR